MHYDSVSVPANPLTDIPFSTFHFFSRNVLTTCVIQTNQLWEALGESMEPFLGFWAKMYFKIAPPLL